jgi:hypothetical protein
MSFTVTITENKPTNVAELETTSEVFRQTSARPASGVQRSEQETAQVSRAEAGAEGCRAVSDWRSRPRKPRPDMVANNPAIVKHGRAARLPGNHIYRSWESMKGRITNPKHKDFANYGGRGLDMDPRWMEFAAFEADMGPRPDGTSLGRIDNSKGYWLSNCRWETPTQQSNNRRCNQQLTIRGVTQTFAQWAGQLGLTRQAIRYRVHAGWTPEQILTAADRGKRRVA